MYRPTLRSFSGSHVSAAALLVFSLFAVRATAQVIDTAAPAARRARHAAVGSIKTPEAAPTVTPVARTPHPLVTGSPTTTTLSTSSSSLANGSALTLTATVSNSNRAGQVVFCDLGTGSPCTLLHILATRQLVDDSASYSFIPPPGTHTYQAVFLGTLGSSTPHAASASPTAVVTVSGSNSTTLLTSSGSQGNYTLTATVTGKRPSIPTGTVTFTNQTDKSTVTTKTLSGGSNLSNTFTPQTTMDTGETPLNVVLADLNGDGILDMAVTNDSGSSVSIYFGSGSGTFTLSQTVTLAPYAEPLGLIAGDFNNDGHPDLATTVYTSESASATGVQILTGSASGSFTVGSLVQVGVSATDVQTADFNRDGNADLAVVDSSNNVAYVLTGAGTGSFTLSTTTSVGTAPGSSVVGDFNNDGIPDLAVVNATSNTVSILLGEGNGSFSTAAALTTGANPGFGVVGDFNSDGFADLAIANTSSNTVSIFKGLGGGTFAGQTSVPVGNSPEGIVLADFNGDGTPDLGVANSTAGTLSILKGSGDGTFTLLSTLSLGGSPYNLATGDLNGDGIADLVSIDSQNNFAQGVLVTGTASSTATVIGASPTGNGAQSVVAAYAGDTNYAPSTSFAVTLQGQDATSTAVSSVNPSSVPVGTSTTLTAVVQDTSSPSNFPAGTVSFTDTVGSSSITISGIPVSGSQASTSYTPESAGTHVITASFAPSSASFKASSDSVGKALTVTQAALTPSSAGPYFIVVQGGSTTINIIFGYPGITAPTGAVTVTVNGSSSGLTSQGCLVKSKHMNCAYTYTDSLAPGQYTISASEAADTNYTASPTMTYPLYVTAR